MEPLREHFAADRHHEWGRREVAERAGELRVERHRRHTVAEFRQNLVRRAPDLRRGGGFVRWTEEPASRIGIALSLDGPNQRLAVEPVEGLGPDRRSEPLEARPRAAGVTDLEELGVG